MDANGRSGTAEKVIGDSATRFGTDKVTATQAGAKGDAAAQRLPMAAVKDALKSWADGLRQQAGQAEDADLKWAAGGRCRRASRPGWRYSGDSSVRPMPIASSGTAWGSYRWTLAPTACPLTSASEN